MRWKVYVRASNSHLWNEWNHKSSSSLSWRVFIMQCSQLTLHTRENIKLKQFLPFSFLSRSRKMHKLHCRQAVSVCVSYTVGVKLNKVEGRKFFQWINLVNVCHMQMWLPVLLPFAHIFYYYFQLYKIIFITFRKMHKHARVLCLCNIALSYVNGH